MGCIDLLWLVLPGSLESQAKILPGCCRSTRGNLGSVTVARGFFVAPYQLNMAWTSKCLGSFQADSWLKTAWIWRDLVMTVFVVKQTFLTAIWSILKCHTGAKPADFVWMCLSSNWNWTPSRLLSRSTENQRNYKDQDQCEVEVSGCNIALLQCNDFRVVILETAGDGLAEKTSLPVRTIQFWSQILVCAKDRRRLGFGETHLV